MSPGAMPGLTHSEVHLWWTFCDDARDPDLLASYDRLMLPAEHEQHARFVFARDAHIYRVSRALVRTVLARYAGVEPMALTFSRNRYGRPDLSGPAQASSLRFNLSHTHGLIAVAVVAGRDVGVDVEDARRPGDWVTICDSYFSPAEVRDLMSVPPARRVDRFFDYWTLKESYIKARGMGLSLPLDGFSFSLLGGGPPTVSIAPALADDPASWQFALFQPSERHRCALAVRRDAGPELLVRVFRVVPGAEETELEPPRLR